MEVDQKRSSLFRHQRSLDQPLGSILPFLLPGVPVFLAFTAFPVIRTLFNSFHRVLPGKAALFIGWDNYISVFVKDDIFLRAVQNTITWACLSPVLEVS